MPHDTPVDMLWRPVSRRAETRRYAATAFAVLATMAGAGLWANAARTGTAAADTQGAVLVDLSPAAAAAPPSDAPVGPAQPATAADTVAPPQREDPAPPTPAPPRDMTKPDQTELDKAVDAQQPKPKQPADDVAPPAPPQATSTAHDETAPKGTKTPDAAPSDGTAARRQAAHALTVWQHALLARLERAKSGLRPDGRTGTVSLAFTLDRRGRLLASRIARSSGSPTLDALALVLLHRAAPFPAPPPTLADDALSFTVPVAFARGR